MKAEIKISQDVKEPYAVIYTNEVNTEISRIIMLLENSDNNIVTVTENGRIIVLTANDIYMIRVENEKAIIYCKTQKYTSTKRLCEFEVILGKDFMRISKFTLINLKYLDCVEPSFGGVMLLILKNGCRDYISRKYLPDFKKYLGLKE